MDHLGQTGPGYAWQPGRLPEYDFGWVICNPGCHKDLHHRNAADAVGSCDVDHCRADQWRYTEQLADHHSSVSDVGVRCQPQQIGELRGGEVIRQQRQHNVTQCVLDAVALSAVRLPVGYGGLHRGHSLVGQHRLSAH